MDRPIPHNETWGAVVTHSASAEANAGEHARPDTGLEIRRAAGPLAGVKVLDFSRVVAGPLCGLYFADLGADVVKIEAPGGDENRRWEPALAGTSAGFVYLNRGKRGMTLNLKSEGGQDVLRRLVASVDVVIDSYLPADAEVLGMSYAKLKEMNPHLIHVSISAYGSRGPMRDHPGYDLLLQAFTGIMQMTGEPDGPPNRAGASVVDLSTGMIAFGHAMSALYARAVGQGGGEHVQASLLQSGLALMSTHVANLAIGGAEPKRQGSGLWNLVPYQAFKATDGWVLIGVTNDAAWKRFCGALRLGQLADNPTFDTSLGRITNRDEIVSTIQALVGRQTVAEVVEALEPARVPVSRINTLRDLLETEQVQAIGALSPVPGMEGPTAPRIVGRPVHFETPYEELVRPAPTLGQHNAEVLNELGFTPEEVQQLVARGAF